MIRAIAGAVFGTLSASFTYLGTDSPVLAAVLGLVAAAFVWLRGDVLLIAVWND